MLLPFVELEARLALVHCSAPRLSAANLRSACSTLGRFVSVVICVEKVSIAVSTTELRSVREDSGKSEGSRSSLSARVRIGCDSREWEGCDVALSSLLSVSDMVAASVKLCMLCANGV